MAKVKSKRKKELIKIKLSTILQKSTNNPKFSNVTIVDVNLSPDSSFAMVYYSVFNATVETDAITEALNAASGFFQSKLSKTLTSRNTPKLQFRFDTGFDHASRIDELLADIKKEEDQNDQ